MRFPKSILAALLAFYALPASAEYGCVGYQDLSLAQSYVQNNCSGSRADADNCFDALSNSIRVMSAPACSSMDPRERTNFLAEAKRMRAQVRAQSRGVERRSAERARDYNRPRGGSGYAPPAAAPPASGYVPPSAPVYTPPKYTCPPGYLVNGHQCY